MYNIILAGRKQSDPLAVDEGEINSLIQQIVELRPALIVIDTFSAAMPGVSDNDAAEISSLSRNCRRLSDATGATVLGVHHPTKEGSTFRGSGAFLANFDFVLEAEELDGDLRVTCQKMRDYEKFTEQRLTFLPVDIGLPDQKGRVIVPSDLVIRSKSDPLTKTQRAILQALLDDDSDNDNGMIPSELRALGCGSSSSIFEACRRLKTLGFISQKNKGSPYRPTEEGRAAYEQDNKVASAATGAAINRLFFPPLDNDPASPSDEDYPPLTPNSGDSELTPGDSEKLPPPPTPDSTPNLSLREVGVGVRVEVTSDGIDAPGEKSQVSQTATLSSSAQPETVSDQPILTLPDLDGSERITLGKLAQLIRPHATEPHGISIESLFQGNGLFVQALRQALSTLQQKGCLVAIDDGAGVRITTLGYAVLRK